MSRPASLPRAALAQAAAELRLTARRGENLLAMLGIPVVVLLFFASSPLPVLSDRRPVDVLVPGSLALAIIASGLVNLGIATAFERSYGVLKRLGGSPLGRPGLVVAKMTAVATIVVAQVVLLLAIASVALGWEPGAAAPPSLAVIVAGIVLGTVAFAGLGLLLAGALRAEATLALANGLFLAALLLGGIVAPIAQLPGVLATVAGFLPAAALSEALRIGLGSEAGDPGAALLILAVWAVTAASLTVRTFRWD